MSGTSESKPYWPSVTIAAMGTLPRVLASMGFDRHCGVVRRGDIAWWRPDYVSVQAGLFDRYGERSTAYLTQRRADAAMLNRAMRDSPVHLLALSGRIIVVDEWCGDGMWRSADGANLGNNLIDLGMWRWSCKFGQAAYRIAKTIGMNNIPTVKAAR